MSTIFSPQVKSIDARSCHVNVKELVAKAADIVAPVWPLKTFIAVNPLQGLETLPFEEAVSRAEQLRPKTGAPL